MAKLQVAPLAKGGTHCPKTQTLGGGQMPGRAPRPPVLMVQFEPTMRQAAHWLLLGSQNVPKGVQTVEPVVDGVQVPPTP